MAEELTDAALERALRELAHDLQTGSPSPGLATAVLTRVAEEPVPSRAGLRIAIREAGSWLRARVRWVVGILLALAFTGLAVSPVGADVARLFGFHGVLVTEVTDAPTVTPERPSRRGSAFARPGRCSRRLPALRAHSARGSGPRRRLRGPSAALDELGRRRRDGPARPVRRTAVAAVLEDVRGPGAGAARLGGGSVVPGSARGRRARRVRRGSECAGAPRRPTR